RILMCSTKPREYTETAEKGQIGQRAIHQTMGNAKEKKCCKRRMPGDPRHPIGFRGAAGEQRTRRPSNETTHQENKGTSHQQHVEIFVNEIKTKERTPQLRSGMFVMAIIDTQRNKRRQRYQRVNSLKRSIAHFGN